MKSTKRTKFLPCIALTLLMLVGMVLPSMAYTGDKSTAYAMYVDDQQVGVVKFAARALSIYDSVEKRLRDQHQEEILIDSKVHFKETKVGAHGITDDKALAEAIEEAINVKMNASAIKIEGEKICYVKSPQDAQKIIDEIKAPYQQKIEEKEGSQLEEISIKEDVNFEDELVSEGNIMSNEEAIELILHGSQGVKEYEVKEGDSLWSIANANDVGVDDLELANPDIEDEIIQPGEIIKIGQQEKLLTVITKEKMQYSEEIAFETETKEDNKLEKGKTKVIQQGEKGQKEILALVTKEDGQEINRDIIEEKVVKEPVKHIEAKGTKVVSSPSPSTTNKSSSSKSSSSSSKSSSNTPTPTDRGSKKGSDVVSYAKKFLGYPYKYGTQGPNSFDCSGFTSYVYKQFGVNISSGSVAQRSVGRHVDKSDLRPGDIVCFKNTNHVGIYIGGGQFIHASSSKTGVIISSLNTPSRNKRYVGARRIFD